ncbi:MAG: hypothetical protein JXR52_12505 [Bacteroidales bacterium]|nr:hypothetical protein [Bacteroidales bacterium]MBN2699639.1 hypothetical protein [Bacteroidales bacterium]
MKTNRFFTGLLLTLSLLIIPAGCEVDNATLLTDGIWTFEDLTTDSEDQTIITLIAFAKALLTDATLEFQEGGNYLITSPLLEDPTTGTWSLVGDDQLIMDPDDEPPSTGNIDVLTRDKLVYIETFSDGQVVYSITTTWIR